MRVRARARQRHVELPLIISDHADWNELVLTIGELRPEQLWITHGAEEALLGVVHIGVGGLGEQFGCAGQSQSHGGSASLF